MPKQKKPITDIIIPEKEIILSKAQEKGGKEPMETEVSGHDNIVIEKSSVFIDYFKRRHEEHYKGKPHNLVADIAIIATVLLMVIFTVVIYWGVGTSYNQEKVNLDISIEPENLKSIDNVTFSIEYKNNNPITLRDAKLVLIFPDGFDLKQVNPSSHYNQNVNVYTIGDMPANSSGKIEVSGDLISSVDEASSVSLKLLATVSTRMGTDKEVEKDSTKSFFAKGSNISFNSTEFPGNWVNGQETDIVLQIKNESGAAIENLSVNPAYPQNYELISASPSDYIIGTLKAGEEKEIKITGKITNQQETEEQADFRFDLQINVKGKEMKQAQMEKSVKVIYPKAKISIGLAKEVNSVGPDNILDFTINYENAGQEDIRDANVSVELNGLFYNLRSIQSDGQIDSNKVIWRTISVIKPGEKGEKKFSVRLYPYINLSKSEQKSNFVVSAISAIEYKTGEQDETINLKSVKFEKKVDTLLSFAPMARYYFEGEQIGRGPLPPRIGKTTKYWILGQFQNTTNGVENIEATGILGENVKWTGQTNIAYGDSQLTYDDQTRKVSWKLNQIPDSYDSNINNPNVMSGFAVDLTPTADQISRAAVLLKDVRVVAQDKWTGATLDISAPDVTTDLIYDEKAQGKGKVSF